MAMEANVEVESIHRCLYQSEGTDILLMDKIPEKKDDNEVMINHMLIEQLLGELGDDERKLIELRYYQEKTQSEVAATLGISQVQVSRLEKKDSSWHEKKMLIRDIIIYIAYTMFKAFTMKKVRLMKTGCDNE